MRLVVTRGAGALGLDPEKTSDPQIIVIADHITLYPAEFYENGLEIVTAKTIRNHPQALNPQVKSLNYLNNILAKIEGAQAGCVEAIMLNHHNEVAECTGDNIFLVREGNQFSRLRIPRKNKSRKKRAIQSRIGEKGRKFCQFLRR